MHKREKDKLLRVAGLESHIGHCLWSPQPGNRLCSHGGSQPVIPCVVESRGRMEQILLQNLLLGRNLEAGRDQA